MTLLPEGKLYIDGKLREAEGGAKYANIGPWTGEVVGYAADASAKDMEEALAAARRAFDESDWPTNHAKRRELVWKLCEKLRANRDRLAEIAVVEGGAALGGVSFAHVDRPLTFFEKLFETFDNIEWDVDKGEVEFFGMKHHRVLAKEAAGVVGAIIPWNVPFYITVGKVIPALLAGCTVILKPAPETPLMSAIVGELAAEAGLPAGVLNVVSGKSAAIVLDDAPDFAGAVCGNMVVFHAGQGCANITRLLVPRSRYAEAEAILTAAYQGYAPTWGKQDDPANVMGPVISARQRDRVMGYIRSGLDQGARLIAGGGLATEKGTGFFVEPTCFFDVTNDMKIAQEEIFGPVLVVIPYEDEDDAVRIANDSVYGLSGGVVSADPQRALGVARRIRTGTVGVNGGMSIDVDLPFGGYRQSGIGKEWGIEGFEEYLETKSIAVASPA